MKEDQIKKFWHYVNVKTEDACWTWNGRTNRKGTGVIRFYGKETRAPRIAYMLKTGVSHNKIKYPVAHLCNNTSCVNPKHLFLANKNIGRPKVDLISRFWTKVAIKTKSECWIWQGHKTKQGYGSFNKTGYKNEVASRVAFELTNGPIENGLWVLHRCDNPQCVNPEHLFLGTSQDNIQDKVIKKRQQKGEKVNLSKLNEYQVKEIRKKYKNKYGQYVALGKQFGVAGGTIRDIVKYNTWKHI